MRTKLVASDELGPAIRKRREELQMTAAAVAQKCGMSKSYLCQIERGDVSNPTVETLARITDALGIDLVVKGSNDPTPMSALAYGSPLSLSYETESEEEELASATARKLQRVLNDQSIPQEQRTLLRKQITALIETVEEAT